MTKMNDIVNPPENIEVDENGVGLFFMNPTQDEIENSGDKQWSWSVSNNYPDRQYRKGARLLYFTSKQIDYIRKCQKIIDREQQVLYNALYHIHEILFPSEFKTIDFSDHHEVALKMFDHKISKYTISDLVFCIHDIIRDIFKGEEIKENIINLFIEYVNYWGRNENFQSYSEAIEKLSTFQKSKIDLYLQSSARIIIGMKNVNLEYEQ